jgi:hypothetical protein
MTRSYEVPDLILNTPFDEPGQHYYIRASLCLMPNAQCLMPTNNAPPRRNHARFFTIPGRRLCR